MRIGVLARAAEVSVDAVRLYEARGLIRADRRANGYRDFPDEALAVVRLIRQGQRLGFTLRDIGEVLANLNGGGSAQDVAALLTTRIAEVNARIASLHALRGLLEAQLQAACPLGIGRG